MKPEFVTNAVLAAGLSVFDARKHTNAFLAT